MCAATSVVVHPMSSSSSAVCGSCDVVVRALSRATTEVRSGGGLKYPQQSLFNGSSAAGSGAFSGKPAAELRTSFRGERVAVVKVVSSGSSSRTAKKKNKGHSCGSITAELSLVEYAPLTAAVYGAAILGGGLFACKKTVSLQGPRSRRQVVFSPCFNFFFQPQFQCLNLPCGFPLLQTQDLAASILLEVDSLEVLLLVW